MESLFGFREEEITVTEINYDDKSQSSPSTSSSSSGYKLVPWLNWQEWTSVRDSLFSDSPEKISSALARVSTWRSRGCLPVVVDVTASIVEIQLKDPRYRKELSGDIIHSEQMLAMLYCMAILRLVNCVVEKTRKKTEISIAEAAGAIGIPRTLIDIRHEGSHRDLPALALVQDSATKALNWLKSYYWEPQSELISQQKDETFRIRYEIKTKFRELAYCLKVKHNHHVDSSLAMDKGNGRGIQLCGRNKFLSLAARKLNSSKYRGSKKHIMKILKALVRLYSSFSSEVVSVLLDFLLKALASAALVEHPNPDRVDQVIHASLDDWKLVITKFSNKKPELLLMLLKAVLDKIENQDAVKYETGRGIDQIEQLSYLFSWLVGRLERLKTVGCKDATTDTRVTLLGKNISYASLMEVLRKCLLVSAFVNKELMDSAIRLAKLMGNSSLIEKLNKLRLLSPYITDEVSLPSSTSDILIQYDETILQASKKLDLIKLRKTRSKVVEATDGPVESSGRWVVAKSWNPCPIGMLPADHGFSGLLPVLHCDGEKNCVSSLPEWKQTLKPEECGATEEPGCEINDMIVENPSGKREASYDIRLFEGKDVKKMREAGESSESDTLDSPLPEDVKGCLMINGVWKKIGEEELLRIQAGVRILV